MKKLTLILLLLLCNHLFAQKDSTDLKIIEMMKVVGSTERMKQVYENLILEQEMNNPDLIVSEFWQSFKNEEVNYTELLDMIIPIYKKYLTVEEIESITTFYSSPLGQKLLEKMPLILVESMKAGEIWAEQSLNKFLTNYNEPIIEKFNSPALDCSSLKTGEFKYINELNNEVIVIRNDSIQKESSNGTTFKLKIEWFGECQYKLWLFQDNGEYDNIDPFIVTVYEITDDAYKFISILEGGDEYHEGEMTITD